MPKMPNRMNINSMKTTALSSELTEPTSELTNFLIVGNALILLSGRRTRNVRNARTLNHDTSVISMIPVTTTTKSNQFQASRRYAFLCMINPCAKIFSIISNVNNIVKT